MFNKVIYRCPHSENATRLDINLSNFARINCALMQRTYRATEVASNFVRRHFARLRFLFYCIMESRWMGNEASKRLIRAPELIDVTTYLTPSTWNSACLHLHHNWHFSTPSYLITFSSFSYIHTARLNVRVVAKHAYNSHAIQVVVLTFYVSTT